MAKEGQSDHGLFGSGDHQTICLTGRERAYTIHNYEVVVHASPSASLDSSTPGSSKVQVSTLTNQNWELSAHPGNMVAANTNFIAYILEGRSGYVLRVIHRQTNNRALLKGFTGPVLDVGFAPGSSGLLACVDQGGNLFVWNLGKTETLTDADSTLQLRSERSSAPDHTHHRLSWCPYIPQEEGEDEEEGWLLATSHGCEVEVYSLGLLLSSSRPTANSPLVLHHGEVAPGRFVIPSPHTKPVLDLSLSPDGGVLATSSEDGHLKFWQVTWDNTVPDTLHDFSPHGGEPVTRLIFCDNHTTQDELAQFWRFLITGANGNREVKLWCTVTWRCLQTFHFLPPQENTSGSAEPNILLNLDLTASYLIATDTSRMTLYVFQLAMDGLSGQASLTSITEYLLTQPILSFVVAGHTPCPTTGEVGGGGAGESEEEEEGNGERVEPGERGKWDSRLVTVLIKLFCIHTRSMQELQVRFEPPDIMGVPPDPLPVPLFSESILSSGPSKPKSLEKPEPVTIAPDSSHAQEERDTEQEPAAAAGRGETGEEEETEEADGGSPVELSPQPASLPSSFPTITSVSPAMTPLATSTTSETPFLSLPSLPGVSPKLVTPSAFLSGAKIDISPSPKSSSPPPPPLIPASPPLPPSPHHHSHTVTTTPPTNNSILSFTASDNLISVSPLPEPSDATFDPSLIEAPPIDTPTHWPRAPPSKRDENRDDDEKERAAGRDETRERESSDIEELRVSQLVDQLLSHSTTTTAVHAEREGSNSEKFSDIFGLDHSLHRPSDQNTDEILNPLGDSPTEEGGADLKLVQPQQMFTSTEKSLNYTPTREEGLEVKGVADMKPVRPQQMFTSTEKSEIVTIPSTALTPTKEERAEVVNTTGTPSAEFMELFSNQTTRKRSKVATPPGGTSEMASGYGGPMPSWLEKVSDNAASAWPDVGLVDNMPRLVPQEDTGAVPDSTHWEGPGDTLGMDGEDPSHQAREEDDAVSGENADSHNAHLDPLALVSDTTPAEAVFPRAPETTEGETGQVLPSSSSDQVTPVDGVLFEREGEGEVSEKEQVTEGTIEETTGAKAPHLVELQSSPPTSSEPPAHLVTVPPASGGATGAAGEAAAVEVVTSKNKTRRKKAKAKQQPPSDATRGPLSDQKLTPSPTLLTNEGADIVGGVDHTHLAQLYQLVLSQQREMAALRSEQQAAFASLWRQLEGVQAGLMESQRQTLTEHTREQQQRLEKVAKERQVMDRQRQDKLLSTVSQTLTSAVNAKLEKLVKTEMKTHVIPAVNRSLTSIQDQLSSSVQFSADSALKEGIATIAHTKGLPEAVGAAVAGSIRSNIQGMYDEVFRTVVLPAFERSSQEMFRQVDDTFRRGISEYMAQLQQQFHQLSEPALQHLATSYHSLHSLLTSPDSPLISSLQREVRAAMQSVVQGVGESVRSVVREEVESALQRHALSDPKTQAVEDRARKEEEIQRLLQSREVNRAFEAALSTSDLSLVLYLCQQVTPEEVFDKTPCPLSQPVLLSLIQQFSVDLSEHVDLKLKFLEASVLALDVTNDITKNHMAQVLRSLTHQLSAAEHSQRSLPNSGSLLRSMRRLRMITERLCPPT